MPLAARREAGPQGKGLYYVNAVDEVTEREVVGAVEMISETFYYRFCKK